MDTTNRSFERAIISIIVIGFVVWGSAFIYKSSFIAVDGKRYFCLFDDAMISMRYAWNFSHGLGLVWNQGEKVQGYTNLLMTLFMSIATLVFDKSMAVLFIQISGVCFMLAIAFVSMKITGFVIKDESRQSRALVGILTFFCVLSYYPLAYWSLMGMETGILTLLLLLGILSALNYVTSMKPGLLFSMAGFLGLAFLTRNDSIIFAILVWLYIVWEISNKKAGRRDYYLLLQVFGLYIVFIIGQLVFQYLYYGEFMPNTYTLKLSGMPLAGRIRNGIGFIKPFINESRLILFLSIVDLVFDFWKRKLFFFSLILSAISYQVYVGGDPWIYWRIMSPVIPLLIILFVIAVWAVMNSVSGTQAFIRYFQRNPIFPKRFTSGILIVSFVLIGMLSVDLRFLREMALLTKPYDTSANQANINTAIVIDQLTSNDASVGLIWAGAIPYYSGRKAIDFLGKSDRYISHLPPDLAGPSWNGMTSVPGHNKYDLNYSIKILKPTYAQVFKWGHQDISQWAEINYVKVEYNGIGLYLLKDSPLVYWDLVDIH